MCAPGQQAGNIRVTVDFPKGLLPNLEALYHLGEQVCAEIQSFQPDVVVGLAHSGWMPVIVARALWGASQRTVFPPAARTNIGQEKHAIYKARFKPPMPAYCCGECCDGCADRLGHYLAWIAEQQPWLGTLRKQVKAVFRGAPSRILVVDDLFGGRRTCYIALGLLETLYPAAQVRMIAGANDLTNDFVDAWLLQFSPGLADKTEQQDNRRDGSRYPNPWHERLKPLITGSEDITLESLKWRRLRSTSPAVQALAGLVPTETVLAAPSWAASLACRYALQRQRGDVQAPDVVISEDDPIPRAHPLEIEPAERLLRQAWLKNGLTRKEVLQAFEGLPGGWVQGMQQLQGYVYPHGYGRGKIYFPEESLESWITAYDPPKPYRSPDDRLHIKGFAEFLPGRLWAGVHPPDDPEVQAKMLADIMNQGVRCFLNLTTSKEFHARWAYAEGLARVSRETNARAEEVHFPLGFRAAPTRLRVSALFEEIRLRLESGKGVFIHAGHNLEGRVPMLLACLLIDQGLAPPRALAQVSDFWLLTLPYLIRLPLSDRQRQFVLHWKPR